MTSDSLIALYEAMTLLELPGGDPIKYYGISEGQPIYIITIATAADQARILYEEIKNKLQSSPYFRNKIGHMDHDRIWLMTPADREKKKELAASGLKTAADDVHGTVVFMSGHSNSDSLLGKRYYTLLFDEVASYKLASSVQSGDRLYTALAPANRILTGLSDMMPMGKKSVVWMRRSSPSPPRVAKKVSSTRCSSKHHLLKTGLLLDFRRGGSIWLLPKTLYARRISSCRRLTSAWSLGRNSVVRRVKNSFLTSTWTGHLT
jgi:hypothetical protein